MLKDEFLKLSTEIFDIIGDEAEFHFSSTSTPVEEGGFFFLFGNTYILDLCRPLPDSSDYTDATYFEFQLMGHKERLLTYRRNGIFKRSEFIMMDFEKRIELAKKHPFISTHAFNRLIKLLDNYPDTFRGSLRLHEE